ncbi:MAG: hypothetical protein EBR34_08665 [Sphingomonadaceae bacterium]|nr:hypothetical protein [Sphingomonadaceae bacterium]
MSGRIRPTAFKAAPAQPARFLTAMLEGSFSCLIFLATIALVAPSAQARSLAMIGFAATSVAIAVMLALPSSWIRKAGDARHVDGPGPERPEAPRGGEPAGALPHGHRGEAA